jgi:hypothetical protein
MTTTDDLDGALHRIMEWASETDGWMPGSHEKDVRMLLSAYERATEKPKPEDVHEVYRVVANVPRNWPDGAKYEDLARAVIARYGAPPKPQDMDPDEAEHRDCLIRHTLTEADVVRIAEDVHETLRAQDNYKPAWSIQSEKYRSRCINLVRETLKAAMMRPGSYAGETLGERFDLLDKLSRAEARVAELEAHNAGLPKLPRSEFTTYPVSVGLHIACKSSEQRDQIIAALSELDPVLTVREAAEKALEHLSGSADMSSAGRTKIVSMLRDALGAEVGQ